MHPLTDQLPDYLDALAIRQACGEIEERGARDLEQAKQLVEWTESFDGWQQHAYTKVLQKSVEEDYVTRADFDAVTRERDLFHAALDHLARLGNEPCLGNSIGNQIAQGALGGKYIAEVKQEQKKRNADVERLTRERDEARELAHVMAGICASNCGDNKPRSSIEWAEHILAERDALRAEVERLTGCLKRANDQAEEFERKWYLRGDDVERLRSVFSDLIAGLDKTHWSSWQSTAHFYEKYHIARAALRSRRHAV